jgi:hypothetical protein
MIAKWNLPEREPWLEKMVELVIVVGIWISDRYIDEENREDVICSAVVPLRA